MSQKWSNISWIWLFCNATGLPPSLDHCTWVFSCNKKIVILHINLSLWNLWWTVVISIFFRQSFSSVKSVNTTTSSSHNVMWNRCYFKRWSKAIKAAVFSSWNDQSTNGRSADHLPFFRQKHQTQPSFLLHRCRLISSELQHDSKQALWLTDYAAFRILQNSLPFFLIDTHDFHF